MGKRESLDNITMHMHGLPDALPRSAKFNKKLNIFISITSIVISILIIYGYYSKSKLSYKKFCGVDEMYNQPFFVELMSNATGFKDNTVGNFKNKISLMRPLEGSWEVALVEISYPKSWKNLLNDMPICLTNDTFLASVVDKNNSINFYAPANDGVNCGYVKSGFYVTVENLIDEIEKQMSSLKDEFILKLPKFTYDNITKLVTIDPGKHTSNYLLLPRLSQEVSEMLGFDNYSTVNPDYNKYLKMVAHRPADITAGLHTLYVYADLVEPQYIGDTRAKLLRSVEVPPEKKDGEQCIIRYSNPHYVSLLVNEFEYIEIDIKDDTNRRVPFTHGRSRIKLHFKPRNV